MSWSQRVWPQPPRSHRESQGRKPKPPGHEHPPQDRQVTAAQSTDERQHPARLPKGVSQLLHDESSVGGMHQNCTLSSTVGHSVERARAQQLPSIRRRSVTDLRVHKPIRIGGSHAHIRMRPRHGAAAPLLLSGVQSSQESCRSHPQPNPARRIRFPTEMARWHLDSTVDDVEQHR